MIMAVKVEGFATVWTCSDTFSLVLHLLFLHGFSMIIKVTATMGRWRLCPHLDMPYLTSGNGHDLLFTLKGGSPKHWSGAGDGKWRSRGHMGAWTRHSPCTGEGSLGGVTQNFAFSQPVAAWHFLASLAPSQPQLPPASGSGWRWAQPAEATMGRGPGVGGDFISKIEPAE